MSGWLLLLLLLAACLAGLWALGTRGALLQLAAAALLIGAAGYALGGRPSLAGTPRAAGASEDNLPLTKARHAFFGNFGPNEHWLLMSESLARRGRGTDAAGILRAAIREHPQDSQLWIGLGNALVDHAQVVTPPAQLAFQRAAELAPGHPAPHFFLGLALLRSGERETALRMWRGVLADAPADASWRPLVEDALAAFSRPPGRP
jgi:cytochrome c-type biogenesis protein CcmH